MLVSTSESPFSYLKAVLYWVVQNFLTRLCYSNSIKKWNERFALHRKLYSLKRSSVWVKNIALGFGNYGKNVGKLRYLHSTIRKISILRGYLNVSSRHIKNTIHVKVDTFLLGFIKAMPKLDLVYCREMGIFGVKFDLKRETLLNGMISQFVAFTGKP